MLDGRILSEKSKEELIEIILGLQKEVEELKQKAKEQQQKNVEKFVKANVKKKRRLKPGQKVGHEGMTRALPDQVDEVFNQELQVCPHCENPLKESIEDIEHIQEDIIPAKVIVRKYRRHRYYCECCRKVITASYHPGEIPEGRLGSNVLIHAAILKYYHCLPYRKIVGLLEDMCGLKVSSGAIAQGLQRIGQWLDVEQEVSHPRESAGSY